MMIIAPLLQKGVDVRLPIAINSASKPETQDQTVLGIKADKTVWINGIEVRREELRSRLDSILETKKEKLILIKADEDAPYSAVMDAMDTLRGAGIEDVGLITDSKSTNALSGGAGGK
jgi:biopolymer transport protein TolR